MLIPLLCPTQEQAIGMIPVRTMSTDHSVQVSDRGKLVTLITEVITVNTKDYKVYNWGLSTPLQLLILKP